MVMAVEPFYTQPKEETGFLLSTDRYDNQAHKRAAVCPGLLLLSSGSYRRNLSYSETDSDNIALCTGVEKKVQAEGRPLPFHSHRAQIQGQSLGLSTSDHFH